MYGLIGARIGYGIGPDELIKNMGKCSIPSVNLIAEVGACASINDENTVAQRSKINREQKKYLQTYFEEMELNHTSSQGNFVWVDVREDSMHVWEKLLRLGVLIRPGRTYDSPTWIRVTIGTPEENEIFIESLKKVLG